MGLSPQYVLDEIEWYEIRSLIKYSYYKVKDGWEQARLISYIVAQVNSTKHLKVDDIMKFHWEGEREETKVSNEDKELLNKKAIEYINQLGNNARL